MKKPDPSNWEDRVESLSGRLLPILAIVWLCLYWLMFFTATLPNNPTENRFGILLQLPAIFQENLSPTPEPGIPSGWQFLGQRVPLLACSLFLLATACALGRLLLASLGVIDELSRASRWALSGGLGLSLLSLLTLGLGLAGGLSQSLFLAVFLLLILVEAVRSGVWALRQRRMEKAKSEVLAANDQTQKTAKKQSGKANQPPGRAAVAASSSPSAAVTRDPAEPSAWLKGFCLILMAAFLWPMLLGALLPSQDFDMKAYHLEGPKEYLLAGRIQFLPHNVYTSFPFLTEMLSLAGMVVHGDWYWGAVVGKTTNMAFGIFTALGVFAVAKRVAGPSAGWLAAVAYLSIPWTYRVGILGLTEGAQCCYVILTALAFLYWLDAARSEKAEVTDTEDPTASWPRHLSVSRWALLLGLAAGSGAAAKYPGLLVNVIPAVLAVILASFWLRPVRWGSLSKTLGWGAVGVLLTFGPWLLKNQIQTGNPVYPFLYAVFGGEGLNAELAAKWRNGHHPPEHPFQNVSSAVSGVVVDNDWQSALLFGFAPFAFFLVRRRRAMWGIAAYAAAIFAVWFFLTHRIDRFWVPMNPLMAVLAGCGVYAALLPRARRRPKSGSTATPTVPQRNYYAEGLLPALRGPVAFLALLAVVFNLGFVTTGLGGLNRYLWDYRAGRSILQASSIALVHSLRLPPDSKVLFVGEAQVFDATFPYAYNTVFDEDLLESWTAERKGPAQWKLLPPDKIRKRLRDEQIDFVFVNWAEILRYRKTYGFTEFVSPARIQELVSAGILEPVPLPSYRSVTRWQELDPASQDQIQRWGPELRRPGSEQVVLFQFFRVSPDDSHTP